jgi:hypothetical protein
MFWDIESEEAEDSVRQVKENDFNGVRMMQNSRGVILMGASLSDTTCRRFSEGVWIKFPSM